MTSSDQQQPDEPAPPAHERQEGEVAPAATHEPGESAETRAPQPAAVTDGSTRPSDDEEGPHAAHEPQADGEGDDDDAPAPGNENEKEGEHAAAAPGGPPAKRKRRRRRKKKPGEGGAVAAVEGAESGADAPSPTLKEGEGGADAQREGEAARKDRLRKKDRPREPRERPAFNFGDIVFGKITEITDDALLIDLSGKAFAIFDRRELDLPDDIEYGSDPEEMDEEPVAPEAQPGEGAAAQSAHVADGDAATEGTRGSAW